MHTYQKLITCKHHQTSYYLPQTSYLLKILPNKIHGTNSTFFATKNHIPNPHRFHPHFHPSFRWHLPMSSARIKALYWAPDLTTVNEWTNKKSTKVFPIGKSGRPKRWPLLFRCEICFVGKKIRNNIFSMCIFVILKIFRNDFWGIGWSFKGVIASYFGWWLRPLSCYSVGWLKNTSKLRVESWELNITLKVFSTFQFLPLRFLMS